jgi:membrane-bound metal-dependent hydrolase YbcI (DUF457 family)
MWGYQNVKQCHHKENSMNLFLTFIMGLIFLTCLYGQANQYAVSWLLVFGMVFSSIVLTLTMTEKV